MFTLFFTAHLLGCLYGALLAVDPEDNWLMHYNPALAHSDDWIRYVTALYWASVSVSTMGYGDIVPVTNLERMVTIAVCFIGAVVFSHCMGLVSSLIAQVLRFRAPCGLSMAAQSKARARAGGDAVADNLWAKAASSQN